jgi:small-conductance mechanosensitive channel
MIIWDEFAQHGIKPPHPQQEIFIRNDRPRISFQEINDQIKPNLS